MSIAAAPAQSWQGDDGSLHKGAATEIRLGPARPKLAALIRQARVVLGADVLLVEQRGDDGSQSLFEAGGATPDIAIGIHCALVELGSMGDSAESLNLRRLAELGSESAGLLATHGFSAAIGIGLTLEGRRVGTMYAVKRETGCFRDERLFAVFARQTALAIGHGSSECLQVSVVEQSRALEALDMVALSAGGFEELLAAIQSRVSAFIGAQQTGLMVWDEKRELLQMVAGSFGVSEEMAASYQIRVSDRRSNAARVFKTRHPYLSNDALSDPGILQDWVTAFGIERIISLPLVLSDRAVGVLHLINKATDFTVEDVERAETFASRIASTVETASTLFRLRGRSQLEGVLAQVAVAIAAGKNIQDFLLPTLDELRKATDASMLAIVPEGSSPLVSPRHSEHDALERIVLHEAAGMPGIRAYVVGPLKVGDPGWAAFHAPIQLGRQRIGTLSALRVRGEPFTQDERDALMRLANLAALAAASERYQQQRAELARLQERQRIADDLHDDVAQILFGVQLQLDELLDNPDVDGDIAESIVRARGLLIRGDTAIRTVIRRLSHPVHADLPQRLTTLVSGFESEFSLPTHLDLSSDAGRASKEIGKPLADVLIKVAREALANAAKHAGPCRLEVSLRINRRGRLMLTVVDDGLGIPLRAIARGNGHGLASLRRSVLLHGGSLRCHRGPAGGMKVTASVPL